MLAKEALRKCDVGARGDACIASTPQERLEELVVGAGCNR